jgi:hypothetical protein
LDRFVKEDILGASVSASTLFELQWYVIGRYQNGYGVVAGSVDVVEVTGTIGRILLPNTRLGITPSGVNTNLSVQFKAEALASAICIGKKICY